MVSKDFHRVINHTSGEIYYFCSDVCAEAFDPWGNDDWGKPEELSADDEQEVIENEYACEFCDRKLEHKP